MRTPEMRAAYRAFNRAKLHAPEACETCQRTDKLLHAHHDNYSKPLDVRWLCASCHGRHHVAIRVAAGLPARKLRAEKADA